MTLKQKVAKSQKIIQQAFRRFRPNQVAVAWTGGKDSTVLLHLVRQAVPSSAFKVMFNDSTLEFPQIYDFVKKISRDWDLNLLWVKHSAGDLKHYRQAKTREEQMEVMRLAKIHAINATIRRYKLKAFLAGIRWDEHPARSAETYFSPRANHLRVHPLLHFALTDIWDYIRTFSVPYVELYDQGYKSLGEAPFTKPVGSKAAERAGREATKEKVMARLRKLGYW